MRIALVILRADARRGGAERYTLSLARALASRNHQVALLAGEFADSLAGVDCITLASRAFTRRGRYRAFLDSLDRHLAECSYDIIHAMLPVRRCDVYHPHAGIEAQLLNSGHLKYDCPVRRSAARLMNLVNLKRHEFVRVERELLGSANPPTVICLSDYVRRSVLGHYQLPDGKLRTIFNGVDLDRFDPSARPDSGAQLREQLRIPQDAVVSLMIAQDFQRKGLAQAIAALAELREPKLRLIVVGKEDPSRYRHMAAAGGVADQVIFAGAAIDPYPFYQAADFFVLPTRHDPCSLVVLEALAMGVPVISTAQNGACEVMGDGRHGFVLDDGGDVPRLARHMRDLLDPAARSRMRAACQELRPSLSFAAHVDQMIAAYEASQRCRAALT